MATFKSQLITAQEAARTSLANGIVNGDDASGELRLATAIVTLTSALTAGDILELCDLPPGATVVPQLCSVTAASDPGTTLSLSVYYTGIPPVLAQEAYQLDLNAAGQVGFTSGNPVSTGVSAPFRLDKQTRLIAEIEDASSITNGVKLVFLIAYRVK